MQKTTKTQQNHKNARGNAMIYVLIVVALFAALTFVMSRQSDNSEANTLPADRVLVYAGQMLNYPYQVKQTIDVLESSGTTANELDFTLPTDVGFDDPAPANNINKIYHPSGGGLTLPAIPAEAQGTTATVPPSGWYLGRFNNFEWSNTNDPAHMEVILVAYNIRAEICPALNQKLLNDVTIPSLPAARTYFIDDSVTGVGTNADLEITDCPTCEGKLQMCVSDGGSPPVYSFYSVMVNQ